MYDKDTMAAGPGTSSMAGKKMEREPAAADILRTAEGLHKRACALNDRMAGKLSPITRDNGPAEATDRANGMVERCFPPFFEQLRQNFRMIELYLNGMEDTLDRVEL